MSAIVCGKRSFFEELPTTPLGSKRLRCSSTSPIRLSPPRNGANNYNPFSQSSSPSPSDNLNNGLNSPSAAVVGEALDRLRAIFPDMDEKVLERALEESGDLESAIQRLNELCLGSAATVKTASPSQLENNGGVAAAYDNLSSASNLPKDGSEWVELFVHEMTSASDMDDARARASRVLELLEKSILSQSGTEAAESLHKENVMLKEQMEVLIRENGILKRAFAIQHERQKEAESKNQEVEHLKQLVTQYQERLRTLEVNNYALTMHLRQAEQSSSLPGRFHPDVF